MGLQYRFVIPVLARREFIKPRRIAGSAHLSAAGILWYAARIPCSSCCSPTVCTLVSEPQPVPEQAWAHRENKALKNYETQAGDRFNDLKRSLRAPVCLQGFFAFPAGFGTIRRGPAHLGIDGLAFLAGGHGRGLFGLSDR